MFVETIKRAWKLGDKPKYSSNSPWAGDVGSTAAKRKPPKLSSEQNYPQRTYKNAPFGTDDEPMLYSTSYNPRGRTSKNDNDNPYEGNLRGKSRYDQPQMDDSDVMEIFRKQMKERGTRGIMSMRSAFVIADDDGSKDLSLQEFKKFCHDFRVNLREKQVEELFELFDRDHSGSKIN